MTIWPTPARRRLPQAAWLLVVVLALTGLTVGLRVLAASGAPRPRGNPDPGHRRLAALKPVLGAIPASAHVTTKNVAVPQWDSCDGIRATYGWDDVTVDADFTAAGSVASVVADVDARLRALGWAAQPGASGDVQYWQRTIVPGVVAVARLFPPTYDLWSIDASAPPAVHSITGC